MSACKLAGHGHLQNDAYEHQELLLLVCLQALASACRSIAHDSRFESCESKMDSIDSSFGHCTRQIISQLLQILKKSRSFPEQYFRQKATQICAVHIFSKSMHPSRAFSKKLSLAHCTWHVKYRPRRDQLRLDKLISGWVLSAYRNASVMTLTNMRTRVERYLLYG